MAQIRKKFKEIQDNIALKTKEIQDLNDTITLKTQTHDELMQQHKALLLKISNDFPERKLKERKATNLFNSRINTSRLKF